MQPLLSVIIVSYNTRDLLKNCLIALFIALKYASLEKETEIIVVDNASQDGSVEMLKKEFTRVIIIFNNKNEGFAKANNQGIKKCNGKYFLLLNSDTEILKDTIFLLLSAINHKKVGITGSQLLNKDGSLQSSGGFFPHLPQIIFWMLFIDDIPYLKRYINAYHLEDLSFYQKERYVDWVSGACFLVKRDAVNKAGMLDENIFMYGEEVEWCYRIKQSGYKVVIKNTARTIHLKGASSKSRDYEGIAGILDEFKFILYFYKKHKPSWQYPLVKFFLLLGICLRNIVFGIIPSYREKAKLYAQAIEMVRRT